MSVPGALESGCPIRLPVFEGPLDLLMHLIRENELEITDLPISQIADQYLEYLQWMRDLQLDIASDYLVMAATLAWIKSRLLLPVSDSGEDEDEEDPRAALIARLLEYQRFKQAAEDLDALPRLGRDHFAAPGALPPPLPESEREIAVSLIALATAFHRVLARAKGQDAVHEIFGEPVSVREQMVLVMGALEKTPQLELHGFLEELCGGRPRRGILVATFLALLELTRLSVMRVFQNAGEHEAPEGPIYMRRAIEAAGQVELPDDEPFN